jgi:hypothetical protein
MSAPESLTEVIIATLLGSFQRLNRSKKTKQNTNTTTNMI